LGFGRRELILGAGAAGLIGATAAKSRIVGEPAHAHDWDWLIGNWDVWHRRLKDRLAGSTAGTARNNKRRRTGRFRVRMGRN